MVLLSVQAQNRLHWVCQPVERLFGVILKEEEKAVNLSVAIESYPNKINKVFSPSKGHKTNKNDIYSQVAVYMCVLKQLYLKTDF